MRILLGTRGSALALRQANQARNALLQVSNHEFKVVTVKTAGDQNPNKPITQIGVGVFVKELEKSLKNNGISIAVHSLKDLPSSVDPEFAVSTLARLDPRDALVCKKKEGTFNTLPKGAAIGTGSPRRKAQLLHARPDLKIVSVRGNVPTRIAALDGPNGLDALDLACAGLIRLGLESRISEKLPLDQYIPAVGQGAIALQTLKTDQNSSIPCSLAEDLDTATCARAERSFLSFMGGGCNSPTSAYASILDKGGASERLRVIGFAATPDGSRMLKSERVGSVSDAEELGRDLAQELIADGGKAMMLSQNE